MSGTISCSHTPFRYAIDLIVLVTSKSVKLSFLCSGYSMRIFKISLQEDDYIDDDIDSLWVRTTDQSMVHYELSGFVSFENTLSFKRWQNTLF